MNVDPLNFPTHPIFPQGDSVFDINALSLNPVKIRDKFAEYIWLDGSKPVPKLRSKTKVIGAYDEPPEWGFDGSSTGQADTGFSDCILKPVLTVPDPFRRVGDVLVLCEVYDRNGHPDKNNRRVRTSLLEKEYADFEPWFGMEQEYTLYNVAGKPMAVPYEGGQVPEQGPFYCAVGAENIMGRRIAEEHMAACLYAGLKLSGVNAEVMPGQWEFQIGPAGPTEVGDHIWLARYILARVAEQHARVVSYKAKPHPKLNGAGMHTNFSTNIMRKSCETVSSPAWEACLVACDQLGREVVGANYDSNWKLPQVARFFPPEYGTGYEDRLTGEHETCRWDAFRYGVSDRGASVRIPLSTSEKKCGYIEDRRPCADANPYDVVNYMLSTILG